MEKKPREGRVENEADLEANLVLWYHLSGFLGFICSVHEGSEATLGPPQEGQGF